MHTHRLTSAHTDTITDGTIHHRWSINRRMIMVMYVWKCECHWRYIQSSKPVMIARNQEVDIEHVLSIRMKLQCGQTSWLACWGYKQPRYHPRIMYPFSMWLTSIPFVSTLSCLAAVSASLWLVEGIERMLQIEIALHQSVCPWGRWTAHLYLLQCCLIIWYDLYSVRLTVM